MTFPAILVHLKKEIFPNHNRALKTLKLIREFYLNQMMLLISQMTQLITDLLMPFSSLKLSFSISPSNKSFCVLGTLWQKKVPTFGPCGKKSPSSFIKKSPWNGVRSTPEWILLYVVSAVFITYLSVGAKMGNLSIPNWNALYWIIILFFRQSTQLQKALYRSIRADNCIIT